MLCSQFFLYIVSTLNIIILIDYSLQNRLLLGEVFYNLFVIFNFSTRVTHTHPNVYVNN